MSFCSTIYFASVFVIEKAFCEPSGFCSYNKRQECPPHRASFAGNARHRLFFLLFHELVSDSAAELHAIEPAVHHSQSPFEFVFFNHGKKATMASMRNRNPQSKYCSYQSGANLMEDPAEQCNESAAEQERKKSKNAAGMRTN
jgi:hypothetical protein